MKTLESNGFCLCTGRWYRYRCEARGDEAVTRLEEMEAESHSIAERNSGLEDSLVEASLADGMSPVPIEFRLRSQGANAEVLAEMEGRQVVLSNHSEPPSSASQWLRRATVAETFLLASRWILGSERMGCSDPVEDVFWFERGQAAAYVVLDREEVPIAALPQWPGAFFVDVMNAENPRFRPHMANAVERWSWKQGAHAAFAHFHGTNTVSAIQVAAVTKAWDVSAKAAANRLFSHALSDVAPERQSVRSPAVRSSPGRS